MSSIDEQFVDFVVKSLVSNPDAVKIVRTIDEKGVLLELTVDPVDLGRVIGKRGATAQSIRTLLRALGTKNDARYNLKIVDNGEPRKDYRNSEVVEDNNDDSVPSEANDQPAKEEPEQPVEAESTPEEPAQQNSSTTDKISQARKELQELDDLDL